MTILSPISRVVDRLIDLPVLGGAVGLIVALGVTLADVVGRALGAPLFGARDIASMAGVHVVFGGKAYAHRTGEHIAVDLLYRYLPPAFNHLLTVAGHSLGAVVFLLIAWQLWIAVELARMLKMSFKLLYLPRAPFMMALAALCLIFVTSMILRALETATRPRP